MGLYYLQVLFSSFQKELNDFQQKEVTMTKKVILGAVASIALSLAAAPAFAQDLGLPVNSAPVGQPTQPVNNRTLAAQYGLPPDILTHEEDRYGRPIPRTIEDSIRDLGVEGARLAAIDDANFCFGLNEIDRMEADVRAADAALREAELAVQNARTNAERRQAEARAGRARNNLFQLLLTGIRIGVVTQIPGVGWAYGAYILGSEASNFLNRQQHNREMLANDANVDLFMAQNNAHMLRVEAWMRRVEVHDRRGELWNRSMRGWCGVMEPYHTPLLAQQ